MYSLSAATIMELVYGIEITSEHDPYIEVAEKSITMTANSLFPGAVLCNLFPSRTYTLNVNYKVLKYTGTLSWSLTLVVSWS